MYKLINTNGGAEIGVTEKPRYIIKKESTGCFVERDEADAQGIVFKGTPYNLLGRDGVGAEETVMLIEFDGGEAVSEVGAAVEANSAAIDELTIAILEG